MSLLFTFALIGINGLIEGTDFGGLVESMTYDVLQHHLSPGASTKDLPVIVLDISGIQMRPTLGARPWLVTDRAPLRKVVDSLMAKKGTNAPRAIGLDVDFSPDANGYAYPDDPALFDKFLTYNKTIPIRVGVNESLSLGPQKWLIEPNYMDLVSCVVVPNAESGQSARYMPEWVVVNYPAGTFGGVEGRCPSMGIEVAHKTVKPVPRGAEWFAESFRLKSDKDSKRVSQTEFLVDYSQLQPLIASSKEVYDSDAGVPINVNVGGKIVLLGRTKNTSDMFTVPGSPEHAYAGVFLHACAAYTLLEKYPLYSLTKPGRLILDLLFSLAIFGPLLWERLRRHKQGKEVVIGPRVPGFLSCSMAVILTFLAIGLVRWTHLMWDDFILVAVALVVHTPIEHTTVELGKWLGETLRYWWRVSTSSPESPSGGE